MLVLSRRIDEKITIECHGTQIVIMVAEIRKSKNRGNSVRLGIEAPPEVSIARTELLTPGVPFVHTPKPKVAGGACDGQVHDMGEVP